MTHDFPKAVGTASERTKILVVDDVPANIKAMVKVISNLDLDVDVFAVGSGKEALSLVIDHDFALALLDVQMPEIDGIEVAELMRGRRESRQIPIIFVTAGDADKRQVFKGYEAGAVDFISKPFDAAVIGSKVRVFVELYASRRLLKLHISEIMRQKEELETLKTAAEAANESKSTFLANMSHEIRTPLGAILGFANLLQCPDQSAKDREDFTAAIKRNGELLLSIINDILDMSKVESGRLELEYSEVSISDLLSDIACSLRLKAAEKGLTLTISETEQVQNIIRTDPTRLKQILMNIIGNAIKFTSCGKVEVTTSMRDQENAHSQRLVAIAVKDSGIGLSASEGARLFQAFVQADSSTSRKFGGTGLGLVIARQLARALGGDVVLSEGVTGEGCLFTITIDPGVIATRDLSSKTLKLPRAASIAELQDLSGMKILIVDDAPDNLELVKHMLKRVGAVVDFAQDGNEAVQLALKSFYDVVLMDVQMPVMSGLEATMFLRSKGFDRPIIALTAQAFAEEGQHCFDAGYSDHISKPIDYARLVERIHFHGQRGLHPTYDL